MCNFQIYLIFAIILSVSSQNQLKPNILFIIVDDLRPVIGGYGDQLAKTPNIDKLIGKSYYFTNVFTQQALCAPSRNSMLTSRRPDTVHLYDFYSYWRDFSGNFTTLPQYLKEFGYHTQSVGKIFHPGISSNYTDDYPYSWSSPTFHPSTEIYKNSPVCSDNGKLKKNLLCPVDVMEQPEKSLPDIQSMHEAKNILAKHKLALNPLFLAVGFHKPHVPFKFPSTYLDYHDISNFYYRRDQFKPFNVPDVAFNPYVDFRIRDDVRNLNLSFPFGPIPPKFAAKIRQHYYSAVTYVDELIGKVLEDVDSKMIAILTSDHGFQLGEHADWEKYSNYETAVKVPLIIYNPYSELNSSRKISNIVELVDVFPTIVDLIGLPRLEKCNNSKEITCTEGKSLLPLMTGSVNKLGGAKESMAFSQYPRPGPFPTKIPNSDKPKLKQIKIMGYSVRTSQFRYTAWIKFNHQNFSRDWSKVYGEELYDHSFDDAENMNLADRKEMRNIKLNLKDILIEKFP